ncbi:MAG: hypothetical protein ACHREM_13560 [Polyangiales bacterium]
MDFAIKFFDEKGKLLTGAQLVALPAGTTYYRQIGGGLREKFTK